jgi:hypothetical protein
MIKTSRYSVGIVSGEVVLSGTPIVIHFKAAIRRDSIGGISVKGHPAEARIGEDGKTVLVDTSSLPVGTHRLAIQGVVERRGGEQLEEVVVPFLVVHSSAPILPEYAVLHAVRLRIGDLGVERLAMSRGTEGLWVDAFKLSNRKTGKPAQLAFDHKGEKVDLGALLEVISKRRADRFGRCHPTLFEAIHKVDSSSGRVPVAIWLVDPQPTPVEKREKGVAKRPAKMHEENRARWQQLTARFADTALKLGFESEKFDLAAPIIYGSATVDAVKQLSLKSEVAGIFLHERKGITDLADSIAIANSDDAHADGFTGADINVAVYEDGPSDLTDLVISGQYNTSPPASDHARLTSAIIRNSQADHPHGHAPGCNLFSANSMDLDAVRWAAHTEGCTVISQSFHRDSEQTSDTLSFDDIYKDNLALHWPYPTICHAAGNGTSTEYVNHKGFNTLTLGSHDDTAGSMASDSVFRNPSSTHGDRELPELAANGVGVSAVGLTMSGTSFAAPAAAGATAVIQSANATLQSWPEGCRAILMAAAWRNPAGGTWHSDNVSGVDARDGSGALETQVAELIARNRRSRNAPATTRGWDVGTFRSSDVDANGYTTYRYQVSVPRKLFSPHVKVALAWDSKVNTFFGVAISSTLTVDLDLHITDANGNWVAWSSSWNNSYEIAEFDAAPGQTYDIRIRRWSGVDDVWFGIAWTVTGVPWIIRPNPAFNLEFQLGSR